MNPPSFYGLPATVEHRKMSEVPYPGNVCSGCPFDKTRVVEGRQCSDIDCGPGHVYFDPAIYITARLTS